MEIKRHEELLEIINMQQRGLDEVYARVCGEPKNTTTPTTTFTLTQSFQDIVLKALKVSHDNKGAKTHTRD